MNAPQPHPALRRLNPLVGTWLLQGRTLDSSVDNIAGWNTFTWIAGGFFMESRGEFDFRGAKIYSLEIIGYDADRGVLRSNVYSNMSGDILPYEWDVQGDTVLHWMATSKYTGTFSPDGNTLTGGWRPTDGSDGKDGSAYDAVMTRSPG